MGVPSYFGWIVKYAKNLNIVRKSLPKVEIERLYFDYNCLIHRACREIYAEGSKYATEIALETAMIENVIKISKEIIDHVQPTTGVYFAIDGSVPMGKCRQQRYRRFKSVQEAADHQAIRRGTACPPTPPDRTSNTQELTIVDKDRSPSPSPSKSRLQPGGLGGQLSPWFDFNAISPGTRFMSKLSKTVEERFEQWRLYKPGTWFIMDDSMSAGEGEHKIMHHVKSNPTSRPIVIYGLDADLIFLSLGLHHNQTYLIRENTFNERVEGDNPPYLIVDIHALSRNIVELVTRRDPIYPLGEREMHLEYDTGSTFVDKRIIDDYIFINFILGNDFVTKIFSLSIKEKGCEVALEAYRRCLRQYNNKDRGCSEGEGGGRGDKVRTRYLVDREDDCRIDWSFFRLFLNRLVPYETGWFRTPQKYYPNYKKGLDKIESAIDEYSIVPPHLHHLPYEIDLNNPTAYYQTLFYNERQENIIDAYLESIVWTAHYYFGSCPDQHYYYPFHYAPLIRDIVSRLTKLGSSLNHLRIYQNKTRAKATNGDKSNTPIHPYHQLMIILPKSSYSLLPEVFHRFLELPRFEPYFPDRFDLYYYGHRFLWECPPKLPVLDAKSTLEYFEYLTRHGGTAATRNPLAVDDSLAANCVLREYRSE